MMLACMVVNGSKYSKYSLTMVQHIFDLKIVVVAKISLLMCQCEGFDCSVEHLVCCWFNRVEYFVWNTQLDRCVCVDSTYFSGARIAELCNAWLLSIHSVSYLCRYSFLLNFQKFGFIVVPSSVPHIIYCLQHLLVFRRLTVEH